MVDQQWAHMSEEKKDRESLGKQENSVECLVFWVLCFLMRCLMVL